MSKYFVLILAIVLVAHASAQDRSAFGLYGHYALNTHTANFQQLPGVPNCCPRFETGHGIGLVVGALYEKPLATSFALQLRAGYQNLNAELVSIEATSVFQNGSAAPGEFTHTLKASLSTIGIEPMLAWRPFGDVRFNVGLSVGAVLVHRYDQREQITQPGFSGTFLDSLGNDTRSRTRNESSGEIPDASSFHIGLLGGISHPMAMNADRTLFVAPEVTFALGLTPIASGLSWTANALRIGVSFLYSPKAEEARLQPVPIVEAPPSTVAPSPLPTLPAPVRASLSISGVEANGLEVPIAQLRVDEYSSTRMTSLLNYVFFDENSAAIPNRYHLLHAKASDTSGVVASDTFDLATIDTIDVATIETFDINRIHSNNKLKTYYHVLNIVGRRLVDNPSATIRLTGCNQDVRDESNNLALSRSRALAVKQYLADVWHINDKRIVVDERNLPVKAANTTMQDGAEENRRVELATDDVRVLAPLVKHDTVQSTTTPTIRIRPRITSDVPIDTWRLTIAHAGVTLHALDGKGLPAAFIDWHTENSVRALLKSGADLTCSLFVVNADKSEALTEARLPVDRFTISRKQSERLGDKEIDRYSLILFDVRSADISSADRAIIDLIKSNIHRESYVRVIGYSDRLGDAKYNQQLAESRAKAVASRLGTTSVTTEGRGQADLFESSLPEGRLYTRTVDVIVETPITIKKN